MAPNTIVAPNIDSFDELPRLLVSFLKFSGWRLLRDDIRRFLDRRPGGLRVLTTTA